MFSVTVRDHMMVAHSLRGEVFGPAQRLHGATSSWTRRSAANSWTTTASWSTSAAPTDELHRVVADLSYRNLDDEPTFAGTNTTTEVLARHVADRLAERVRAGALGTATRRERHRS